MTEPFLNFGDVSLMLKRIGGGGGPHRMGSDTINRTGKIGEASIVPD